MALDPLTAGFDLAGKVCCTCLLSKPRHCFSSDKYKKDGLSTKCKQCVREYKKIYTATNKDKLREADKNRYYNERERRLLYARKFYESNKEYCLRKQREYVTKNRENINRAFREYYKKNKEKMKPLKCLWAETRRSRLLQRIPLWADNDSIKKIYSECDRLNREAGHIKWHVDHEIPLVSKIVSGLHCEENLRIILASINLRKSNKYEVA